MLSVLVGGSGAVGSSAVVRSFETSGGVAEGGENPWLCGTGFRRVCPCRDWYGTSRGWCANSQAQAARSLRTGAQLEVAGGVADLTTSPHGPR
jgi:hypothetical protein